MVTRRLSLCGGMVALMLAVSLAALASGPAAVNPPPASAQTTGSGQSLPMPSCAMVADPTTQPCVASSYVYCSDGSTASVDQGCPPGTVRVVPAAHFGYCPDGSTVSLTQSCPGPSGSAMSLPTATTATCPDGSTVVNGQACATPVPTATIAPLANAGTCPDGSMIPIGQPCP